MSSSRFFRGGGDDSSSESSSDEEELYSEQEESEEKSEEEESEDEEEEDDDDDSSSDSDAGKKQGGASRFLEGWSDSEESETEATAKVKSAKDKRHDELDATITLITNAEKINDWNTISSGKLCFSMFRFTRAPDADLSQSSTSSTARPRSCGLPARRRRLTSSASPISRIS